MNLNWSKILVICAIDLIAVLALWSTGTRAQNSLFAAAPTAAPTRAMPTPTRARTGPVLPYRSSVSPNVELHIQGGDCITPSTNITVSWVFTYPATFNPEPSSMFLTFTLRSFATNAVVHQMDWTSTPPNSVSPQILALAQGGIYTAEIAFVGRDIADPGWIWAARADMTFGMCQLVVRKYEDIDGEGLGPDDPGEGPIANWLMTATHASRAPGDIDWTDSKRTDAAGLIAWNNVPQGTMTVTEEISACTRPTRGTRPPGSREAYQTVNVGFGATAVVTFTNQYTGTLRVCKRDTTGKPLAGVGFRVTPRTPGITFDWNLFGEPVWTKTTGVDGCVNWPDYARYPNDHDLPVGTYEVLELDGTPLSPNPQTVTIPKPTFISGQAPQCGLARVDFINRGGDIIIKDIAVNQSTHRIYATSKLEGLVYVADPVIPLPPSPAGPMNLLTQVSAIRVGRTPWGIAVDETVTAVNSPANLYRIFLPFIFGPQALSRSGSGSGKIYVANWDSDSITVIDGSTNTVLKTISTQPYGGQPSTVAVITATHTVYVPLHASGRLLVIDGSTDTVTTAVDVGTGAFDVAADAQRRRVYVSSRDSLWDAIVDANTNRVIGYIRLTTDVGNPAATHIPYSVEIDPGLGTGGQLYNSVDPAPADDNPDQVWQFNLPDATLPKKLQVQAGGVDGGTGLAANLRTHNVFATNRAATSVSWFDGQALAPVVTHVSQSYDKRLFRLPRAVAIDHALGYVYIGNEVGSASNLLQAIVIIYDP